MPIIQLIVILAIIGFLLYAVNTWIPMADPIKKILNIVVCICVVLWLLSVFGVFNMGGNIGNVGHPLSH